MIVKTRVFDLAELKYKNLAELAEAMGLSTSQVYRVREGSRPVNQKFIIGAVKAFPAHRLDELFYLASKSEEVRTARGKSPENEKYGVQGIATASY